MNNNDVCLLRSDLLDRFSRIYSNRLRDYAVNHTLKVEAYSIVIALKRNLDPDTAAFAALLHDCGRFLENAGAKNHAAKGAEFGQRWLNEHPGICQRINGNEQNLILSAVRSHSDKEKEDGVYDEVLKDADSLASFLDGSIDPDSAATKRALAVCDELKISFPAQKSGNESLLYPQASVESD